MPGSGQATSQWNAGCQTFLQEWRATLYPQSCGFHSPCAFTLGRPWKFMHAAGWGLPSVPPLEIPRKNYSTTKKCKFGIRVFGGTQQSWWRDGYRFKTQKHGHMWPGILNLIQNCKKPKVSISPTFNGGKTGAAQVTSEAHIGQKQTAGGKHILQMFTSHHVPPDMMGHFSGMESRFLHTQWLKSDGFANFCVRSFQDTSIYTVPPAKMINRQVPPRLARGAQKCTRHVKTSLCNAPLFQGGLVPAKGLAPQMTVCKNQVRHRAPSIPSIPNSVDDLFDLALPDFSRL